MEQALAAIGGAIVVALITAVTTDRRLRKQLEAEATRQERAIDAQETRQRADLEATDERHRDAMQAERDLADLADERDLLDAVAVAVYRANDAVGEIRVALSRWGKSIADRDPDALTTLRQRGREFDAFLARASIRFDSSEAVLKSLYAAGAWLDSISAALHWLEDEDSESWKAKRERIDGDVERWTDAIKHFERDAVYRVGSRPHLSL